MLCTNCHHPHGWFKGLCRPCAIAAGIPLVPAPKEAESPEPEIEIVSGITEIVTEGVTGTSSGPVLEAESPKPRGKPTTRKS